MSESQSPSSPGASPFDLATDPVRESDIAVLALSGRFPRAASVDELWQRLLDGEECVSFFGREELLAAGIPEAVIDDPDFVAASGLLEDAALFDAAFFGYSPREAEILDPQHRVFLEEAWKAMEQAGYVGDRFDGLVGVFGGVTASSYLLQNLYGHREIFRQLGTVQVGLGNDKDFLSTKVSYKLNLRGPSVTVQSACSTSLVATHLAVQSLLNGECDMALVGGASIGFPQVGGYHYHPQGIASPDGHCRAFDAGANGSVGGSGVAVAVLRRLEDALEAGDPVRGVIRGSAINNDGSVKIGFTAPSVEGQSEVVAEALGVAELEPRQVSYIEAHGTGTELGDPIEVDALRRVFADPADGEAWCGLGSLKTNIGHLDCAAGIAGLTKAVLVAERGLMPPSLHFQSPNPALNLPGSAFFVPTEATPVPAVDGRRRTAVSSFGLGGTNAHVVVEEAPPRAPSGPSRRWQLLRLSARTPSAADAAEARLGQALEEKALEGQDDQAPASLASTPLADVAYTLAVGRKAFEHRRVVVAQGCEEASRALRGELPSQRLQGSAKQRRPVAFLLSGLGDQYLGMGAGLYRDEPVYARAFDRCAEALAPRLGFDLRQELELAKHAAVRGDGPRGAAVGDASAKPDFRAMLGRGVADDAQRRAIDRLAQTHVAQPALFALGYSLATLWRSVGVVPAALLGYSLGEYLAACLAEVLSLDDALALVAQRAMLLEKAEEGAMTAVPLAAPEVESLLGEDFGGELAIAAVNAPTVTVVSGSVSAVSALEARLQTSGFAARRLETRRAFHHPSLAPLGEELTALVSTFDLSPPTIPYLSNVTGDWARREEVTDPGYWARHLSGTVRFSEALARLDSEQRPILLEIGAGQSLGSLALQQGESGPGLAVASLPHRWDPTADQAYWLSSWGRLWVAGAQLDDEALFADEDRHRVALPSYPFERQRYFVEPPHSVTGEQSSASAGEAEAEPRLPFGEWFSIPTWRRAASSAASSVASGEAIQQPAPPTAVVVRPAAGAASPLAAALETALEAAGSVVVPVEIAVDNAESHGPLQLQADSPADWRRLLAQLREDSALAVDEQTPLYLLPSLGLGGGEASEGESNASQRWGYDCLSALAQAYGGEGVGARWVVVTDGLYDILGGELGDHSTASKATLLGPCRVAPLEVPGVSCHLVELAPSEATAKLGGAALEALASRLVVEGSRSVPAGRLRLTALRGAAGAGRGGSVGGSFIRRWEGDYLSLEGVGESETRAAEGLFASGGRFLITGGLGGLGLGLAQEVVARAEDPAAVRLVLLGRSELPPRERWKELLDGDDEELARRLRGVSALEAAGAEVLLLTADVADEAAMSAAVAQAVERFGGLDGVLHAAGVPGAGLLQLKTPEQAAAVLAPKVAGTEILEGILERALGGASQREQLEEEAPRPFLVLFSALTALSGGIGQVDYTAANAYLGARATELRARGWRAVAVHWCAWRWDSWQDSLTAFDPRVREVFQRQRERYGLEFSEGLGALAVALASGEPEVVVSTVALDRALAPEASVAEALEELGGAPPSAGGGHDRPELASEYVEPRDDRERQLATLWSELLGVGSIGIHDNFFQLGGHSLLGVQLISRVRETLGVEITLRGLFESPTIAGLAAGMEDAESVPELPALTRRRRPAVAAVAVAAGSADESDTATSPPTSTASSTATVAAEANPAAEIDVENLSEAEMDSLLAQLLSTEDASK
ncbi:MAG: SDR family oxidoreductase [Acidobacteriota bacterium]